VTRKSGLLTLLFATVAGFAALGSAQAEVNKITVATQYGLGYMQLTLMEHKKLIEKHAAAAGLGDVAVSWVTFRSSDVMNDALLSGSLQIASLGVAGLATIWAKTKGTPYEVKGLAGMNLTPWILNTRDPSIKSIKDYTPEHRIAVPAVKVSTQALLLQMAAAKTWGNGEAARLDHITVSMSHPDGMVALKTGAGNITSHFTAPPFAQKELQIPGVRTLLTSTEIVGGELSLIILGMPTKFYTENPKLTQAFMSAFMEATEMVNADKRAAAEIYVQVHKDPDGVDATLALMNETVKYTAVPTGSLAFIQFMSDIDRIKSRPTQWTEYMHPIAHRLPGS